MNSVIIAKEASTRVLLYAERVTGLTKSTLSARWPLRISLYASFRAEQPHDDALALHPRSADEAC